MTKEQAQEMLRRVWGRDNSLTSADYELAHAVKQADESYLDCVQRVAGDTYDWRDHTLDERRAYFANVGQDDIDALAANYEDSRFEDEGEAAYGRPD